MLRRCSRRLVEYPTPCNRSWRRPPFIGNPTVLLQPALPSASKNNVQKKEKKKEKEKEEEGRGRIGRRRRGRWRIFASLFEICPWGFFFPAQSHLAGLPSDSAISSFCLQLFFESYFCWGSCLGLPPPCLMSGGAFGSNGMLSISWMWYDWAMHVETYSLK